MGSNTITDQAELERLQKINNPDNLPTGAFTGRCSKCGSNDLWDDGAWYGCNCCNAMFSNENPAPRIIENGTGRDLGPAIGYDTTT